MSAYVLILQLFEIFQDKKNWRKKLIGGHRQGLGEGEEERSRMRW